MHPHLLGVWSRFSQFSDENTGLIQPPVSEGGDRSEHDCQENILPIENAKFESTVSISEAIESLVYDDNLGFIASSAPPIGSLFPITLPPVPSPTLAFEILSSSMHNKVPSGFPSVATLLGHFSQLLPPIESVSLFGFDKKVRDKGGGHTLLTDEFSIPNRKFAGNMRLLWVDFRVLKAFVVENSNDPDAGVNDVLNEVLRFLNKRPESRAHVQSPSSQPIVAESEERSKELIHHRVDKEVEVELFLAAGFSASEGEGINSPWDEEHIPQEILIATNPVEWGVGNIVRIFHSIMEEDVSLTIIALAGLNLSTVSNDEDYGDRSNYPILYVVVVAAAARSTLCPLSLQILLEDIYMMQQLTLLHLVVIMKEEANLLIKVLKAGS
ncbi:hypothetical protein RchiOBHm_Chr1g0313641 [Rosa chinensis]|uniref:Uncharacterized protein n=1 Tax=Rosa chinensis TaxID=74649 RepID=A0A2P6S6Z9_ROSCH|nr:hypothetical protein RchiOBHm_Chr1g0313641 [Rosa chinensis]